MDRKLWVPPPPKARPVSRSGPGEPGRRAGGQGKRSAGRTATLLAALIVALGLLAICLLLVVVLALFPFHSGGRINLLLLGIDRRNGTGWAYRTDTIIVATADPQTRAAGMLSIPRDLQLAIPGYGEDRINTANVYGYRQNKADGGPALLRATVEANFGIPIDGYLMVDFQTFEKIVDALGGIDVNVPKPLHDTRYPDPKPGDPYAFKTIHFDPGWQHMDGKRALEYARSRMSTTDFDRARRQQLILLAIRKQALSLGAIPRWPSLAATVMDGVKTDMDLGDLLAVAFLAVQIDTSNLKQVVLEHPLVVSYRRADGAAVQLPNWDLINPVIEDLFGPRSSR
jgi:polyisoprenyl-teichoic acid--peptidoglycan teichoic acid transferase